MSSTVLEHLSAEFKEQTGHIMVKPVQFSFVNCPVSTSTAETVQRYLTAGSCKLRRVSDFGKCEP